MKIHNFAQGSGEWFAARRGVVTASEVDALVTPLWKVRTGAGVNTYLNLKVAERIMGYSKSELAGWAADQGNVIEKIARPFFEVITGQTVQQAGFVTTDDGKCGCSPDGLLGEDGGLELKAPQPPKHIEYLLAGVVPPDYRSQVQFSLWITRRAYWQFVSFSVYLPPLIVRVEPDKAAFSTFNDVIPAFLSDLDAATTKVTAMMQTKGRG